MHASVNPMSGLGNRCMSRGVRRFPSASHGYRGYDKIPVRVWGSPAQALAPPIGRRHESIEEPSDMTTVHDPERKRALILRLKRVEGQLRGIQKLLDEDADCEKVAQQLAAARKALDKSFFTMVSCVIAQGDVPADDVADMLARFS